MTKRLDDLCFYHWSPRDRRASIVRSGFLPNKPSLQGEWRPPFICFSDEPHLAWILSGRIHPEITEWDLWMVFAGNAGEYETIFDTFPDTGRNYPKEYRVYHRIKKSDVIWIASRDETIHHPR